MYLQPRRLPLKPDRKVEFSFLFVFCFHFRRWACRLLVNTEKLPLSTRMCFYLRQTASHPTTTNKFQGFYSPAIKSRTKPRLGVCSRNAQKPSGRLKSGSIKPSCCCCVCSYVERRYTHRALPVGVFKIKPFTYHTMRN